MKVTKKFQWKIPNFSKLNVSQLYSNTFDLGGFRWKVRTNPKRYHLPDYFPLFLLCCSDPELKLEVGCGRGRPRTIQAKYSFTLVDQVNGRSFTKRGGKQNFEIGGKLRGFESFIHYKHLFNPIEGFIVDDTIVIEARVSTYNNIASPVNVTKINEFGKCYRIVATEVEWKVSGVSEYEAVKSDNFLAGGCEWNIVSKLKRYDDVDYMSLFLRCCSDMGGKCSWGCRRRYAEYSFTLVDQINYDNSLTQGGKQNFTVGHKMWGYKRFISLGELFDPNRGLVVNNTILLQIKVSTEERTLSDSDSAYDHQRNRTYIRRSTEDWQDPILISSDSDSSGPDDIEHAKDQQPDRPSVIEVKAEQVSVPRNAADQEVPPERVQTTPLSDPKRKGSAAPEKPDRMESTTPVKSRHQDRIIISLDSDSSGQDDMEHETDRQPDGPSIREVKTEQWVQTTPLSNPKDFSGLTSSKLIEELSIVTINNTKSRPMISRPALLLEEHRAKMARYVTMSLESLYKSNSFKDIERTALHITNHDLHSKVDKENIKSLLTDIKQGVPGSMSAIETSSAVETSTAQTMEELDGRLNRRQEHMSWLEVEVSRLTKEETDLEAKIQQLIARKGRVGDRMNSTSDELGKVSEEAWRELEEVKEQSRKRKRAAEDKLAAEENLAQLNASWQGLKLKLGL